MKLSELFTNKPTPFFKAPRGVLFNANCNEILPLIKDDSVDTIFADPPFNLNKDYGLNVNDNMTEENYIKWCDEWITEGCRILKPGGSFFLYNIPKWNVRLASCLEKNKLEFRHWIAISMKCSLPIQNKLYPAHYSMLYYSKGKPKTVNKIRTPIETCRHCDKPLKDYGGHKDSLHPDGINLTDVWTDISPVRHSKFKSDHREANQLSTKILERVINLSTNPGEVVVDPFGGSGTTFAVCEQLGRHWIGVELGDCSAIIDRLTSQTIENHINSDKVCAK